MNQNLTLKMVNNKVSCFTLSSIITFRKVIGGGGGGEKAEKKFAQGKNSEKKFVQGKIGRKNIHE